LDIGVKEGAERLGGAGRYGVRRVAPASWNRSETEIASEAARRANEVRQRAWQALRRDTAFVGGTACGRRVECETGERRGWHRVDAARDVAE
jgi:hypothetical protein